MSNLTITNQNKPIELKTSMLLLKKKINLNQSTTKRIAKKQKKQSKKRTSALELLFLSNFFWGMNDFGDTLIK